MRRILWKTLLGRLFAEIGRDNVLLIAAGAAFYVLLSLAPFLSVLISLYGLAFDPHTLLDQLSLLHGLLPPAVLDLLRQQIQRLSALHKASLSLTFAVSLLISLWSASSSVSALFSAVTMAYGATETRSYLRLTALSLVFTLIGALLLVFILATVLVLPAVLGFLHLGAYQVAINAASLVLLAAGLFAAVALLYRYGPGGRRPSWRQIWPGATLASAGMLFAAAAMTAYMSHFKDYGAAYGSLGAIIGFMTLLWLMLAFVLTGSKFNALLEQTAQ